MWNSSALDSEIMHVLQRVTGCATGFLKQNDSTPEEGVNAA
jgi:hypothetical protein